MQASPIIYEPLQTLRFEGPNEYMGAMSKMIGNKRGQQASGGGLILGPPRLITSQESSVQRQTERSVKNPQASIKNNQTSDPSPGEKY